MNATITEYNTEGEVIDVSIVGLMTYDEFEFNYERSQLPLIEVREVDA